MITCEHAKDGKHSCDNCNREMPLILKYEFSDKRKNRLVPFGELHLCEDCSCALSNLYFKVMKNGVAHQYDMDEITEVTSNV